MKYKTEWDLGLLYKNEKDPRIEQDIQALEVACAAFEKKYKTKDTTSSAKKVREALQDYLAVQDGSTAKPWWYFALRSERDSADAVAGALATKMQERLTRASNKTTFFILTLGAIPLSKQKQYLKDPLLAPYRYFLERVFMEAAYTLSEKEEQLAGLLTQTSYTMWVDAQRRLLNQKTVEYKGERIPLTKAREILNELPKKERRDLHNRLNTVYKENSSLAEAELNAIVNYKKIIDTQRGFKKPYSSILLANENDEKTIEDLVSIVTKYFKISKRFYAIHAKLLGEKVLSRADRMTPIGKVDATYAFDEAVSIVKSIFSKVDGQYADIVQSLVDNGQVDIYPKVGKAPGAFCWGMGKDLPLFILLNHIDNLRSVTILAHEMGHAIHGVMGQRVQPKHYDGHSTAVAEVASTFFEQLTFEELAKTLPEKDQLIVLHSKLLDDITAIFGQIAGFRYEIELHQRIREKGQLEKEEIALLLCKHYDAYSGPAMPSSKDDGYHFVGWSHTRYFFYIYTYAYGQLISRSLYEKWKADPKYAKKIEQFLSAGRSMSPKDIFKSIGIATNEAFFEAGLRGIESDIVRLQKLAKKLKKI